MSPDRELALRLAASHAGLLPDADAVVRVAGTYLAFLRADECAEPPATEMQRAIQAAINARHSARMIPW